MYNSLYKSYEKKYLNQSGGARNTEISLTDRVNLLEEVISEQIVVTDQHAGPLQQRVADLKHLVDDVKIFELRLTGERLPKIEQEIRHIKANLEKLIIRLTALEKKGQ